MLMVINFDSRKIKKEDNVLLLTAIELLCLGKTDSRTLKVLYKLLKANKSGSYTSKNVNENDFIKNYYHKLVMSIEPLLTMYIPILLKRPKRKLVWAYNTMGVDTVIHIGELM